MPIPKSNPNNDQLLSNTLFPNIGRAPQGPLAVRSVCTQKYCNSAYIQPVQRNKESGPCHKTLFQPKSHTDILT